MAIKTLRLRHSLDLAKDKLDQLCKREAELTEAQKAFEAREAEIETAINEAESDEDKQAVDAAIDALDAEEKQNEADLAEVADEKKKVEDEISDLENKLKEEEESKPEPIDEPEDEPSPEEIKEERKENKSMETRTAFFGMTRSEAQNFVEQENVHAFLERVKELGMQKRTISGGEALIPTEILDLLRQNISEYSKLLKHTRHVYVAGKARQVVNGAIPEAVWTEMCGVLNELSISFANVEVDGFKVGGVICVCNQLMHDSDIDLARELIEQLGAAVGIALDKAIVAGSNTKMPLGFVTRLLQTSEPSGYTGRTWVDLHTSNVKKTSNTGATMYSDLIGYIANAKGAYSKSGRLFFAMNSVTLNYLIAQALSMTNGLGASFIESLKNKEFPVVGGAIEILEFIPDNMIFGGYDDLYLVAERDGAFFGYSENVKWVEDQTVFKGRVVYDGEPVIAEGFIALGVANTTPAISGISFASDTANP